MERAIEDALVAYGNFMWGTPLLVLLLGGGIFFFILSKFVQFKYFGHAINVLRGKYDNPDEKGEINHYQALSTQLASTVGMGNISGVAVAITAGGPGAIFWMWVSAFFGMATKYFTCTLAIMYRGKDSAGELQGGPMYVVREGLNKSWHWLSVVFCLAGMIGVLPVFQANQLTEVIHDVILVPNGWGESYTDAGFFSFRTSDLFTGLVLTAIVVAVIFGGIKRIGTVAGNLVPTMVVLYFVTVFYILVSNIGEVGNMLALIVTDAFTGKAIAGGAIGAVIMTGARRSAFSNEAGIGTAPMAHGAAKTDEPVREGLVAMIGPAIDTLVVCTLTALAILSTGVWQSSTESGVSLTIVAFEQAIPGAGSYILTVCATIFAVTSLFSLSYYGEKCFSYLAGAHRKQYYNYFYVSSIIVGSVASLTAIIALIDGLYATMAIPTMISAILLNKKVRVAALDYFRRLQSGEITKHG